MNRLIKNLVLVCLVAFLVNPAMAFNNGKNGRDSTPTTQQSDDNTPPIIIIASPFDESAVSGRVVDIYFYAWDVGGLAKFELYIDHVLQTTLSATARDLMFKWRTQKYAEGEHTLEIIAYDRSGNSEISLPVNIYLAK